MNRILFFLLLIFSIVFTGRIIIMSDSLMINYYPYISPDGFDWITEGFWLSETLQGKDTSEIVLPIGRPPLFVFITALDAFFGQKGYVIAAAFGFAFLATGFFATRLIQDNKNFVIPAIFLLALLFTPVNFVRMWVLADAIGVFVSLVASYYLLESKDNISLLRLVLLSIIIALAGLTQTYGLIAPFVILGILFLFALKDKNYSLMIKLLAILSLSALLFFGATSWWFNFILHLARPMNFELLQLSTAMLSFYLNTWIYYFAPLAPMVLIFPFVEKHAVFKDKILISIWAVVITFMVMVFFYQWPESRFTFVFWPFLVIAVFRAFMYVQKKYTHLKTIMLSITTILLLVQSFALYTSDWQPRLRQIEVNPEISWIARLMRNNPGDWFFLEDKCGEKHVVCRNIIEEDMDVYVGNIMRSYMQLVELSDTEK